MHIHTCSSFLFIPVQIRSYTHSSIVQYRSLRINLCRNFAIITIIDGTVRTGAYILLCMHASGSRCASITIYYINPHIHRNLMTMCQL